ncbi:MAG: DNA-directed RNA polymerase subunit delta [Bacilli bacterium]|jgi:DNA-directed RNA polymerase subunit delta
MAENYKNESMVDVAYSVLKDGNVTMNFVDLYNEVLKRIEVSVEDGKKLVANFYTNLSLDGRFVDLKNNEWGLRERETYDKVHIDMNDVYSDIDEETEGNTDVEELDDSEKEELIGDDSDADDDKPDGETDEEASSTKEDM